MPVKSEAAKQRLKVSAREHAKQYRARNKAAGRCYLDSKGTHPPPLTPGGACQQCRDKYKSRNRMIKNQGPEVRVHDDVGWGQYRRRLPPPVSYTAQQGWGW